MLCNRATKISPCEHGGALAKIDILELGRLPEKTRAELDERFAVFRVGGPEGLHRLPPAVLARFRGIARGSHFAIPDAVIGRLPNLEIIASFGVGYDGIDTKAASERGIVVTNTPDVLTEEVADSALALILMTVRELPRAERHLRSGNWVREGNYPLTATLRDRTVGIVGLGRIGLAIARRLDAMRVPVVYHARRPRSGMGYHYFADLHTMATAVDLLVVVIPGTPETENIIDGAILAALGPAGVLINIGRGSVVDERALIEALKARTILAAGLDVFREEPNVNAELIALPNTVLLPHVGSASAHTRNAMGQLVVDNLISWFDTGKPVTPVSETPWRVSGGKPWIGLPPSIMSMLPLP
jgi:lactate dehydrogenase-like 2-hydroxyacid dehydrogenase